MRYILLASLIAIIAQKAVAQGFVRSFEGLAGSQFGRAVRITADGGLVLAGSTSAYGASAGSAYDAYVVHTDAHGDTIWTRTFGGNELDVAADMTETSDHDLLVVGSSRSFNGGSMAAYVIRMDMNGALLWSRTYSGPGDWNAASVAPTQDGGAIVAGSTNAGNGQMFLLRIDADGDTVWTRCSTLTDSHGAACIRRSGNGTFLLAGTAANSNGWGTVMEISCWDEEGDLRWDKVDTTSFISDAFSVTAFGNGGIMIAGRLGTIASLVRLDSTAATIWSRQYAQVNVSNKAYCAVQTSDGGFAFSGDTDLHTWLVRTDAAGNMLWQHTYGASNKGPNQLVRMAQGSYAIGGEGIGANGYAMCLYGPDEDGLLACMGTPPIVVTEEPVDFANRPLPFSHGCVVGIPATVAASGALVIDPCGTTSTPEMPSLVRQVVYPVPATDLICIPNGNVVRDLEVLDLAGRVLASVPHLTLDHCLDVQAIQAGVYMARWRDIDGEHAVRFVKQ